MLDTPHTVTSADFQTQLLAMRQWGQKVGLLLFSPVGLSSSDTTCTHNMHVHTCCFVKTILLLSLSLSVCLFVSVVELILFYYLLCFVWIYLSCSFSWSIYQVA